MTMLPSGVFGGSDPNDRDTQPSGWARTRKTPDIHWKYHHVIPWEVLRDTWQALLTYQCWDQVEAYLTLLGVPNPPGKREKLRRQQDLDQQEREEIYQRVSWPAWNIVEGPGDRDDEGGSEVDLFHEGLRPADRIRHVAIDLLWKEWQPFLTKIDHSRLEKARNANRDKNVVAQVHVEPSRAVAAAAAQLGRAMLSAHMPSDAAFIPYTASMWTAVRPGYIHKQYPALWVTSPAYVKARAGSTHVGDLPPKMRCPKCKHVFYTPNVVLGAHYPCPGCQSYVYMDFKNGVT
jgi:hypothetical protein